MADFNQIFTDSSLLVRSASSATLGFNDGLLISKSKYALENHMLTLDSITKDNVSIFYNNGIANTYEFSVRLCTETTTLPSVDLNEKSFTGLTGKYILVFVNGELQPTDAYTITNTSLTFTSAYTTDVSKFFEVIVYVSTVSFSRTTYTQSQLTTINTDTNSVFDAIQLPVVYSHKNTAIFINGEKVSFLAIERITPDSSHPDAVKLNIPSTTVYSFEILKFDSSTDSINFVTESGYLTYGPYDDYSKKIPTLYDTIITFSDQAKLIVDNLRAGFIVKETDAYGELLIVDDTFETPEVKCITVERFRYSSYTKNEYYLEVPEYTKITKYLAEFDRKYTFLPEILLVFQRLLLDELNDSIQRLRDMRSIQKVDSVNINKLLKLLGFNANIKTLNIKQRHELLEELNEFHRIAGTRYSYNLVNILQNNLKLINMEQLFTPYGLQDKSKKTIYRYNSSIADGNKGTGYKVGDYLKAADGYMSINVDEVDSNGAITGYTQQNEEGYVALDGVYPLSGGLAGYFNITSPTNQYTYTWTTSNSENCEVDQILQTSDGSYKLKVTGTDGQGHITSISPQVSSLTGSVAITDVVNQKLYPLISNVQLRGKISSADAVTSPSQYELLTRKTSGIGETLTLSPGKYYIKMSGGGGSGSCSTDATVAGRTDGYAGEYRTYEFTLTETSTVTYYVGEGGGGVYAYGATTDSKQLGNGYEQGAMGQIYTNSVTTASPYSGLSSLSNVRAGSSTQWRATTTIKSAFIGGQGGGSSALITPSETFVAKGGNGGNASETVLGGNGGSASDGMTSGSGSAGTAATKEEWSLDGTNGYIEIYRIKQAYTFTIDPDSDTTYVTDNQTFNLTTSYQSFTVTAHRSGTTVTFTITPTQGYPIINTSFIDISAESTTVAYLTITSTASAYIYQVQLETDYNLAMPGMVFTGTTQGISFTYLITSVNRTSGEIDGIFSPSHGTVAINNSYATATYQTGTNAKLTISSEINTQKNVDRCYIDFYTREELGGELVSNYVSDAQDYLTITEGTPHSPQFWVTGEPDVDYGEIANTTQILSADYDYGYITDKVAGQWVEYWNWERESIWYPTNHVNLEMKIPVGVDIGSYVNTFIEQFYNIASTVLFIHSIIESFYFGNEGDTNASTTTYNGIPIKSPAEARPTFGIATGAPLTAFSSIATSNPLIQYTQSNPDEVTLTIVATPANAQITISSASGLIVAQGTGRLSYTATYGTEIIWSVSKTNYITRAAHRTLLKDATKYIILEKEIESLTAVLGINPTPSDATVTLTATGYTQSGNSIEVREGTTVNYSVSKLGYTTISSSIIVVQNITLPIELQLYEPEDMDFRYVAEQVDTLHNTGMMNETITEIENLGTI